MIESISFKNEDGSVDKILLNKKQISQSIVESITISTCDQTCDDVSVVESITISTCDQTCDDMSNNEGNSILIDQYKKAA